MITVRCSSCHIEIYMSENTNDTLRRTQKSFYCLNGHSQWYPGPTPLEEENTRLKAQLEAQKQRTVEAERESQRARDATAKAMQEARLSKNACKHCHRRFDTPDKLRGHVRRIHEKTLALPEHAGKSN